MIKLVPFLNFFKNIYKNEIDANILHKVVDFIT